MFVCICNAIRETKLRESAQHFPGDAEAVYAALGKVPRCKQCLERADAILEEERQASQLPVCVTD